MRTESGALGEWRLYEDLNYALPPKAMIRDPLFVMRKPRAAVVPQRRTAPVPPFQG
jgi:hypothetical protein